jgi:uncharacterized small protein (DUF1192 family)
MKKMSGVCFVLAVFALGVLGAPASRAQSRKAASGSEAGAVAAADETPAPAASPAALDQRIEALEAELTALKAEMAAKKEAEAAPAPTPAAAAPADDAKPAEKVSIASLLGPTSVSGFVDAYYQYDTNHPMNRTVGLAPFDFRDKSISLNMIELILDKAPDPMGGAVGKTGYHVALGYGDAENVINSTDPGNESACNLGTGWACGGLANAIKEAYFSYLAPVGSGLQVDVGKFVTPMGAEVIESKDNWNYSRGLLFGFAIPYYHFGARAKYTFNSKYNLTGFVVNGWNNVVDNNSGKTFGFSFVSNPTKTVSYTINYLAGPETNGSGIYGTDSAGNSINVNDIWRQTWDAVVTYNPTAKWSLMANFDYGRGDRFNNDGLLSDPVYWTGGAAYVKYAIDANDYLAGRYEYYYDPTGFSFGPAGNHVQEGTITYQRTVATHLLTRLEYRYDNSVKPLFFVGAAGTPLAKTQNTIELGLIFLFDSRDAK